VIEKRYEEDAQEDAGGEEQQPGGKIRNPKAEIRSPKSEAETARDGLCCESDRSWRMNVAFPLTPALSLGGRGCRRPRIGLSAGLGFERNGLRFSLSLRERVGVRGKGAASDEGDKLIASGGRNPRPAGPACREG